MVPATDETVALAAVVAVDKGVELFSEKVNLFARVHVLTEKFAGEDLLGHAFGKAVDVQNRVLLFLLVAKLRIIPRVVIILPLVPDLQRMQSVAHLLAIPVVYNLVCLLQRVRVDKSINLVAFKVHFVTIILGKRLKKLILKVFLRHAWSESVHVKWRHLFTQKINL